MHWTVRYAAVAACLGVGVGVLVAYAAAQHSPLGEYSGDGGGVNLLRLLPVFGIWFGLTFICTLGAGLAWRLMRQLFR
jgi:ABC-type amino acid transport system permease subunit